MNLLHNLTGGRPMVREGHAFIDVVSGQSVYYYRDRIGRRWLAEGPWSFFRVPITDAKRRGQSCAAK